MERIKDPTTLSMINIIATAAVSIYLYKEIQNLKHEHKINHDAIAAQVKGLQAANDRIEKLEMVVKHSKKRLNEMSFEVRSQTSTPMVTPKQKMVKKSSESSEEDDDDETARLAEKFKQKKLRN